MSEPVSCPSCAAPIVPGDAFCENCGATIDAAQAVSVDPPANGDPAVHVTEAGTNQTRHPLSPPGGSRRCLVCGGGIDEDGFCEQCGQRAPTERDHWTESPSAWVGGVCDRGIVHPANEDAMAIASTPDATGPGARAVLVVCDGVTSAPESGKAAVEAVREACRVLVGAAQPEGSFPAKLTAWEQALQAAATAANAEAVGVARMLGDPPEPPSCTFVGAVVVEGQASVAWCGDSRAYWLPDGTEGTQLTTDHSVGTELIAAGATREQAEADPACHTITRWLGADSVDATAEVLTVRLDAPGWLLVCSDGMWNYASTPGAMRAVLDEAVAAGAGTPTAIAESMAAWANAQGGHDNVTVVLARHDGPVP